MTAKRCHACRSGFRSWAEHANTEGHRKATTSIRSTGPKGSAAYKPPAILPRSVKDYEDDLARRFTVVPSIDTLPPVEIGDPDWEPVAGPAVRSLRPAPCQRCGRPFRTQAGADWHAVNNPRCDKWRPAKARRGSEATK